MTTTRSTATEPATSEPITMPPFAVISSAQVQVDDFFHELRRYG